MSFTVAVIGRPNVGKSTLLNRLVAQKIAAMSAKPQTTRNKITGVVHLPGGQIVLVDTPGIHDSNTKLNRVMVKASFSTYNDVDLILFLIDASRGFSADDEYVLQTMQGVNTTKILILNKIDLVKRPALLELAAALNAPETQDNWVPLSSAAIFEAIDAGEFAALDAGKKARVDRILGLGEGIATTPGSKASTEMISIFDGVPKTIASLVAIANQKVSLAVANRLGTVRIGDVTRARAI